MSPGWLATMETATGRSSLADRQPSGRVRVGILKSEANVKGGAASLGGLDGAGEVADGQGVALAAGEDVDDRVGPVVVDDPDRHRVAELPADRAGEGVVPDRPVGVADDRRGAVGRRRRPRS